MLPVVVTELHTALSFNFMSDFWSSRRPECFRLFTSILRSPGSDIIFLDAPDDSFLISALSHSAAPVRTVNCATLEEPRTLFRELSGSSAISDVQSLFRWVASSPASSVVLVLLETERLRTETVSALLSFPRSVRLRSSAGGSDTQGMTVKWVWKGPRPSGADCGVVVRVHALTAEELTDWLLQELSEKEREMDKVVLVETVRNAVASLSLSTKDVREVRRLMVELVVPEVKVRVREWTANAVVRRGEARAAALTEKVVLWVSQVVAKALGKIGEPMLPVEAKANHVLDLELPLVSKMLLIASFLASFVPRDMDIKLFGDSGSMSKKRRTRRREPTRHTVGKKIKSSLMLGPQWFHLDRMIAIYMVVDATAAGLGKNGIMEHQISSLYTHTATLISKRLLQTRMESFASSAATKDESREADGFSQLELKCLVPYSVVQKICLNVNYDLLDRLIETANAGK